mgnify:CR=1 FL=1
MLSGSSPLARGLRNCAYASSTAFGIIPARAGFTEVSSRNCGIIRDHPRSRGVYAKADKAENRFVGSSPLARGLPVIADLDEMHWRIIPARAGFTHPLFKNRKWILDHPRSRGVYPSPIVDEPARSGSSPLARGLQQPLTLSQVRNRIIPARAGFTQQHSTSFSPRSDHPRSRGVYVDCA